jgi:hypothetical protein
LSIVEDILSLSCSFITIASKCRHSLPYCGKQSE